MIRFDIHNEKIISRCAWMQPDMALGNDKAEISPDGNLRGSGPIGGVRLVG